MNLINKYNSKSFINHGVMEFFMQLRKTYLWVILRKRFNIFQELVFIIFCTHVVLRIIPRALCVLSECCFLWGMLQPQDRYKSFHIIFVCVFWLFIDGEPWKTSHHSFFSTHSCVTIFFLGSVISNKYTIHCPCRAYF